MCRFDLDFEALRFWANSFYRCSIDFVPLNWPWINFNLIFEITPRQQKIQFRPPLEEIRGKYFREMKKFIGIPNIFKGVSEAQEHLIYPAIIDRNGLGFITCYVKANELFKRVEATQNQFRVGCLQRLADVITTIWGNISWVSNLEKKYSF